MNKKFQSTKKPSTQKSLVSRLIPSTGYLLIEPFVAQTKTLGGIYLPESSDEKPQKGTVLAVGADEVTESGVKKTSPVKKDDVVIYKKWGGNEVKIENKEYLFVKFEDVLAIEV